MGNPINKSVKKPQVILRMEDEHGIHLVKKWPDNTLSIEGHTNERATNHNINFPAYFFPIDDSWARELFKDAGKEYRP